MKSRHSYVINWKYYILSASIEDQLLCMNYDHIILCESIHILLRKKRSGL